MDDPTRTLVKHFALAAFTFAVIVLGSATPAAAQTLGPQERMCDPTFEDCRADILTYIRQETVAIDMGFWMMGDARYSNELVRAHQRGVKIRLLMDPRCGPAHPSCLPQIDQLAAAGVPMRNRRASGILHWKVILFAGQGQVEFSGANYVPFELRPEIPYVNFTDEIVHFSNDPKVVQSFMTKFDDLWTSTTEFANYANITEPLARSYDTFPIDPELNFPPDQSFRNRSITAYNAEKKAIDVLMFRITDERHTDAIIAAVNRGIPVRLITDHTEYRNEDRLWHAYNVDKLYAAGVQVRLDGHQGINHAKGVVLYSQGLSIFGSSNWTSPSSSSQREHNYFTKKPWIHAWMADLFDRKWTNRTGNTETAEFVPLPPSRPSYRLPANGGTNVATTGVTLTWNAGLWAHLYDIYFGTTSSPPLLAENVALGPSQSASDTKKYPLALTLQPGTRYFWKIVSKTMAGVPNAGVVWSFTTAGGAPANTAPAVTMTAPAGGATFPQGATVTVTADATDSDGTITKVEFRANGAVVGTATSAPFSVNWSNVAAGTYNLTATATDNLNASTTSTPVSITVGDPPAATLPEGWSSRDIGAPGATGSSRFADGTFTVTGAGADVWGTADAFQFAYRQMTGDGTIVARVATVQNTAAWFKAGVMIRNNLAANSAHGFMLVSLSKGTAFQRRKSDGNTSLSTAGTFATAPRWVKLTRTGNTITAFESANGTSWIEVGSDTFTMGETVYVGLAVSSHVKGVLGTSMFDNVAVIAAAPQNAPPSVSLVSPASGASATAPGTFTLTATATDSDGSVTRVDFFAGTALIGSANASPYTFNWNAAAAGTYSLRAVAFDDAGASASSAAVSVTVTEPAPSVQLPQGWSQADIGAVPFAGGSTFNNGTFTITGSGADVWGTADAFHYAYRTLSGDGTIVARVATVQNVDRWVKAGVMIRADTSAGSAHAFMLVSPSKGLAFQRRPVAGGISVNTAGAFAAAPRWVKLTRTGDLIESFESVDGVTWTLVGSETIPMGANVLVGLAVTSHTTARNATATFDNVTVESR
jgi:phosphatidylserine/phosphatidylglycerophosphate/cardiolipin synthase-like enzyme/regulation of enolase protein 1 (concanavalin A-like superfamily)